MMFAALTALALLASVDPAVTPPTTPAPAATAATPAQTDAAAPEAPKAERVDRIVCRMSPVTGSRLRKEKICLTKRQWETMAADARTSLGKTVNRGNGPGGGN